VKKQNEEPEYLNYFSDRAKWELLTLIDIERARKVQAARCPHCGGRLDVSHYPRQPRGGPDWKVRYSYCCAREGCRRRCTPESVRFLGRRVYVGFVVVLITVMHHGVTAARARALAEHMGVDRRTLERWRQWWLNEFVRSRCWQALRAMFAVPPKETTLPWSLYVALRELWPDGLLATLDKLAPMTTAGWLREPAN